MAHLIASNEIASYRMTFRWTHFLRKLREALVYDYLHHELHGLHIKLSLFNYEIPNALKFPLFGNFFAHRPSL
jgi:hypothetical protein